MLGFLQQLHPIVQALLAGFFTWGLTALGAAMVFMTKEIDKKILDTMLGFAAGVMIAASYCMVSSNGGFPPGRYFFRRD
jgi:ZIP family zinc transporter